MNPEQWIDKLERARMSPPTLPRPVVPVVRSGSRNSSDPRRLQAAKDRLKEQAIKDVTEQARKALS